MRQSLKVRDWPPVRRIGAEGFELRGLRAHDIQPFYRSIDDEVRHWLGYRQQNVDSFGWVLQLVVRYPTRVPPIRPLAVIRDDEFAGVYLLAPSIRRRDRWGAQLAWWLAPDARGQGLGRASLDAALGYVRRDLHLRVLMVTEADNVRAVRQIEGAGAVLAREELGTLPNGRVTMTRRYHYGTSS